MQSRTCPNCGGNELYQSGLVSAGGGYAPNYAPDLGKWYRAAQFRLVLCRSCGLTRFFADADAREKVAESDRWEPIT